MKTSLLMDFSVDRENNKITVKREFAAPLDKVWAAWTQKEILDQWWAPKPWKARTKNMDFREGGVWVYAMVGPDGDEQLCRVDYKTINPKKEISGSDAFSNKDGKINKDFPVSYWKVEFEEKSDSTIVTIKIRFDQLADLEKYIEMDFKEGFTAALENLDEIFK